VSRRPLAIALLVALGAPAAAHWVSPGAIVAQLNAEPGRARGVEQALRDGKSPRLLVIRVGERWYALPAAARRAQATAWLDLWRHNVAQGIVAILDDHSERPVVRFGSGGRVVGVSDTPPR